MGVAAGAWVGKRHLRYRWSNSKAPMNSTRKGVEYRNVDDSRVEYDIRVPITIPLMTIELILSLVATSGPACTLRRVGIPATPISAKMAIRRR